LYTNSCEKKYTSEWREKQVDIQRVSKTLDKPQNRQYTYLSNNRIRKAQNRKSIRTGLRPREPEAVETGANAFVEWAWEQMSERFGRN